MRAFAGCALLAATLACVWTTGCKEGVVKVVIERPTSQPYMAVQAPASQPYLNVGVTVPRGLVENTNDFSNLLSGKAIYVVGGVIVMLLFAYPVQTWFRRPR